MQVPEIISLKVEIFAFHLVEPQDILLSLILQTVPLMTAQFSSATAPTPSFISVKTYSVCTLSQHTGHK